MTHVDRRTFVKALVESVGMCAAARVGALATPTPGSRQGSRNRIDVHHHFAPPAWIAEVKGRPLLQPANETWTVGRSLEDMDTGGVATAILSVTNPGLWFGDPAATRRVARASNEYGAKLVQDYPTRFGQFAAMPLPDVDATLSEIAYAYDDLKVDGVCLFTSYGDVWLGNPAFRPVMEELNRRRAVVHVHPTAANCCRNLDYARGIAPFNMEYGTDTTRAIIGVTFNGDAARYSNIRFIWSHAGGTAPFLAGRIERSAANARDTLPNGFIFELKKFYYDVAGASNRGTLASLLELVPPSHVLFGTDFPPGGTSAAIATALRGTGMFSAADLRGIEHENALRLLPRLR